MHLNFNSMKYFLRIIRIISKSLLNPVQILIYVRDLFKQVQIAKSDSEHLNATLKWLCLSQDVENGKGCSGVYSFEKGWKPPYPETTGYIIPTFICYGDITGDPEYLERAIRLGDWEIEIQLKTGAVRGGIGINEYPIVFNTGQVILGWVSLFDRTGIAKYREAAIKAGKWLIENQDEDGGWSKNTYNNIPHAYNSRVAWAMLELTRISGANQFKVAAENNVRWTLSQARGNGWIDYMGFTSEEKAFTHTIAYTLSGLLECHPYVENKLKAEILQLVEKISEIILMSYGLDLQDFSKINKFLPGAYDINWNPDETFSCLTGNAQMAIFWLKLYNLNKDMRLFNAAVKNIEQLKSTQNLTTKSDAIRGGIAGSYPVWGKYVNFGYPNWAAKFFADSLILKKVVLEPDSLNDSIKYLKS